MNRFRYIAAALSLSFVALVSVACSSGASTPAAGQSPTPPPTSTATPGPVEFETPTPTPVIVPSATPVDASPTPGPTATAVPIIKISLPPCDTGGRTSTGPLGTAPGPTPTPLPGNGLRDAELISRELSEYFTATGPVASYLAAWSDAFNSTWSASLEPGEEGQALEALGIRVAQACDAVRQIMQTPPEAAGFDSLLRDAARIRHAWAVFAAEQLECCGEAFSSVTDVGNIETSAIVSSLAAESASLMEQYSASPAESQQLIDAVLGIEIVADSGWLVSADGLNPVLYAPFDLNRPGLEGLGPDRWQQGAAVRVRRLRNPTTIDAETASRRFTALITQQGSVSSVEQTFVAGVPALRHVLSPEAAEWDATVTVFVSGNFTYFIETGCPVDVAGACLSVESVAASLKLSN